MRGVFDVVVAGRVIDRGEMLFSNCEADGFSKALAEGSGGDFDAGGFAVFRVAGRVRAPLAELLELVHGQVVAGEVEHTVKQRGGVAVRQHEAVAVRPERVFGVVLHELVVEDIRDGRAAERRSGVAAVGLFNLVYREENAVC